jgi:hypothetical protein
MVANRDSMYRKMLSHSAAAANTASTADAAR